MYGCAITSSDTSSSLGVTHGCLSPCSGLRVVGSWGTLGFLACSLMSHSWSGVDGYQPPRIRLAVASLVSDRILHCRGHCSAAPGASVGVPGLPDGAIPEVRAHVWQGGGRFLGAAPEAVVHAEGLVAKLHPGLRRMARQHRAEFRVGRLIRFHAVPMPRGGADPHEAPGVEAESAEHPRAPDDRLGFVEVEARRREGDLEGEVLGANGIAGGMRLGERSARPLA